MVGHRGPAAARGGLIYSGFPALPVSQKQAGQQAVGCDAQREMRREFGWRRPALRQNFPNCPRRLAGIR